MMCAEKGATHDLRSGDGLQLGQGIPERLERREYEQHERESEQSSEYGVGVLALEWTTKYSAAGR